ncbi:MAG: hypothetical protein HYU77_05010 [Betaproteobacteria bacterium]|nr:hypothetical protein [Betaproteobacteria bacterium]
MEWLLSREAVVGLAILGGAASTLASVLKARGAASEVQAARLNLAGYVLMGLSMVLFVIAGFRGSGA